jgi:hypothetical protein
MTSRTVSSSAATSRAIADTSVPEDEARVIVARQTRIGFPRVLGARSGSAGALADRSMDEL